MEPGNPEATVELLTGQVDLLRVLRDGPKAKGTLVEVLPVSRSTVDRAVRELEGAGLIERDGGTAGLTVSGRLLLEEYEEFRAGVAGLQRAATTIEPVPPNTDIGLEVFRGATIVGAEPHAPYEPVQALKRFLRGAERIYGVASAVLPDYVDLYSRQIIEEGTEVELVVSAPVLETLVGEYSGPLEDSLETGRLTIYEVEADPPFSTILAFHDEPEVGLVVYGDSGTTGFVRNDSPEAVEWAEGWIESWVQRGVPIDGAADA